MWSSTVNMKYDIFEFKFNDSCPDGIFCNNGQWNYILTY